MLTTHPSVTNLPLHSQDLDIVFSSPLAIPVSLSFSSNSRVLNQTVFAGGCSIPHHCWSFLRVKGLNDHSVFSFSSVFEILFHEAHAGSLQLIINTSGHPIVNI